MSDSQCLIPAPMSKMIQKHDNIIWRNVDNETLFLDTSSGYYFSLNETGSEIWNLLSDGLSIDDVAARLSDRYGIELAPAKNDVSELLAMLREEKIIQS
jgi:hypothetical protein